MLKKLLSVAILFIIITAVFTPMCDTALTAGELAIPMIIGIAIARLYIKDILAADNAAARIKIILSAVAAMTAILSLVALSMVEIEALDWTYIGFDDAMMVMIIMGVIGVILELAAEGIIKMIRRFTASSK